MITHLYRYPVKGLDGKALQSVSLIAYEGLAGDRVMAIARQPNVAQLSALPAVPKTKFLMLMRDEALARVESSFDGHTNQLTLARDGKGDQVHRVDTAEGRDRIAAFFRELISDASVAPSLLTCNDGRFTDIARLSKSKMNAISLINLNSVKALEEAIGQTVDPQRFRANVYFDGVPAWAELNWVDQEVRVGGAGAKVTMRTTRCAATQVNPHTAERDIDVPSEIRKHFGHSDMGVYAEITDTGVVSVGDTITATPG